MFIRKKKLIVLMVFLVLLLAPTLGQCLQCKSSPRQAGNVLSFVDAPKYVINHMQNLVTSINQQPVIRRSYFLRMFSVVEMWLGYVLILVLLLPALWFYRRYEIRTIKRLNSFNNKKPETGVSQENDDSDILLDSEREKRSDQCLTSMCDKRSCFFYMDGNLIHIEEKGNSLSKPATIDLLLTKIDGIKLCNHLCREKENEFFPASRYIPKEPFNTNNNIYESPSYKHLIKPYNLSNENHSINLFYFFSHYPVIHLKDTPVSPFDAEFIKKTAKTIEVNYPDYQFSAEHLADKLNMSISQVNRKLNALSGNTAGHLISTFRLQRAAELLIHKTDTISDICYNTGYNGIAYFSRAFRREFGCSPSVYRRLMTKKSISVRK